MRKTKFFKVIALLLIFAFGLMQTPVYAYIENPVNEIGDVSFSISGTTQTGQVNEAQNVFHCDRANIDQGTTVEFRGYDSASVLGNIRDADPTSINGNLSVYNNIQLFLTNSNGFIFGPNSVVDAPGLVVSTLNISNADFLAGIKSGEYKFTGKGGKIENYGNITANAPGGFLALLGNSVQNFGVLTANLGTVILAAGEAITLNLDSLGTISVVINEGVTDNPFGDEAAVKNTGTITANGGTVILTAKVLNDVFDQAVNNEGIIEARSLENHKGQVYLLGKDSGNALTVNDGTIDVSGAANDDGSVPEEGVEGGFIEISGSRVDIGGTLILDGLKCC